MGNMYNPLQQISDWATDDVSATGDDFTYTPAYPVDVWGYVAVVTTAIAGSVSGAAPVIKVDKRITAGSDTGRGDGDVVGAATLPLATAAGKGIYKILSTPVALNIGEQAVIEVTTAATGVVVHNLLVRRKIEDYKAATGAVAAT